MTTYQATRPHPDLDGEVATCRHRHHTEDAARKCGVRLGWIDGPVAHGGVRERRPAAHIGRPSAAPPLLGLDYERVAELVEGRVNATTSRAARRWLRGLADMGVARAVSLADAAGLDLGALVRELAGRIREQRGEE